MSSTEQTSLSSSSAAAEKPLSPPLLAPILPNISASTSRSTLTGDIEEDDEDGFDTDAEEEGMLWDAQSALITHQHDLAIQLYTKAALPPHRSALACLALGNLLTRGTGTRTGPCSPSDQSKHFDFSSPKHDASSAPTTPLESLSIITRLTGYFGFTSISVPPHQVAKPPPRRLLGDSWSIPKEGKRAQRDVQGMGVAAGWLLLGLAWIIEQDKSLARNSAVKLEPLAETPGPHKEDPSVIIFSAKGKGKEISSPGPQLHGRVTSDSSSQSQNASSTNLMSSSGSGSETAPTTAMSSTDSEQKKLALTLAHRHQLVYDLLRPLLHLYRNGQIQAHDPVFLPPIPQADLPQVFQGSGDVAKGRNAYALGGLIAQALVHDSLHVEEIDPAGTESKSSRLTSAIKIMSSYVLGMTAPEPEKAEHFANVINVGHCNLSAADDLIKPASQRLESLNNKTRSVSAFVSKPNTRSRQAGHGHRRILSTRSEYPTRLPRNNSLASFTSSFAAGIQPSPIRSATSSTSIVSDLHPLRANSDGDALNSLKRLNKSSSPSVIHQNDDEMGATVDTPDSGASIHGDLPSPAIPLVAEPDPLAQANARPAKPKLRHIQSSPVLYAHQPLTRTSPRNTSSAFLTPDQANIAPIDGALAAAELASALTKQVHCSVCGAEGVNFPECRKCGLHFCSRDCRIGAQGAGDGKKHHCGLLEERRKRKSTIEGLPVPSTPRIAVH